MTTTYTWLPISGLNMWDNNDNWDLGRYPNDYDAVVQLNNVSTEDQTIDVNALIKINKLIVPQCEYKYLIDRMMITFGGVNPKIEVNSNYFSSATIICLGEELEIYTDKDCVFCFDGQFSNLRNIRFTGYGKVILTNNNYYDKTYVDTNVTLQISDHTDRGSVGIGDVYNSGIINVTTKGVTKLPNTIYGDGVITYEPGL